MTTILALLFVGIITVASDQRLVTFPKRPVITYNSIQQGQSEQIQKQTKETLRLTCSADYPIKWIIPNNSEYQSYSNPNERLKMETHSQNHISLILPELQYTDTGFYRCVSIETSDNLKAQKLLAAKENRIYVFVGDPEPNHLFLHLKANQTNFAKDELSYINCLVTDITATVELYIGDLKIDNVVYEEGFGFQMVPGDGKWFCQGGEDSLLCLVECKAKTIDGKSDSLPVIAYGVSSEVSISPANVENEFYLKSNVTMTCKSSDDRNNFYSCKWTADPKKRNNSRGNPVSLVVNDVDWTDEGHYQCACRNTKTGKLIQKYLNVVVRNKPQKDISEPEIQLTLLKGPRGKSEVIAEPKTTTLFVKVRVHVMKLIGSLSDNLKIEWRRRYSTIQSGSIDEEISDDNTFKRVNSLNDSVFGNDEILVAGLTLQNTLAKHSGEYILNIRVYSSTFNYTFLVNVPESPKVNLVMTEANSWNDVDSSYLEKDHQYDVWCITEGSPLTFPLLQINPCVYEENSAESCKSEWIDVTGNKNDVNTIEITVKNATFQKAVYARTEASKSGWYRCQTVSMNDEKKDTLEKSYIVTDVRDAQKNKGFGIEVENFDHRITFFSGSTISIYEHAKSLELICKTQLYDYEPVTWYHQTVSGVELKKLETSNVTRSEFSIHYVLILKDLQMNNAGKYLCKSSRKLSTYVDERSVELNILKTVFLTFGDKKSAEKSNFTYHKSDSIFCDPKGDPKPEKITWSKDGVPYPDFVKHGRHGITLEKGGKELKISTILEEDKGIYACELSNYFNRTTFQFHRDVVEIPPPYLAFALAGSSGLLGISVVTLIVALAVSRIKYRRKLKKLQQIQRDLMASADLTSNVNDDRPLNEQYKFLPYKTDFELPPSVIPPKNAKPLGIGQFGKVVQWEIKISHPPPLEQHDVAVKCIPNTVPIEEIGSILNEVKIMIHVGDHVNILNLIGAVTSHLYTFSQTLYLVTECCALGSLDKLIEKCRKANTFVDELQPVTTQTSCAEDQPLVDVNGYFVPTMPNDDDSSAGYGSQIINAQQFNDEDRNGYMIPSLWKDNHSTCKHRSHWPTDSPAPTSELCTSDLLFYCYQIANGMKFLFSKKVIHRDLAIRNVLVNGDNIVRISDFGLSQEGNDYKMKSTQKPLPVRYLALEVFESEKFSLLSDVWTFGVTLWEVFTLGKTPYSGMNQAEIKRRLKSGYRLPKPKYAPDSIYDLMQQCWSVEPRNRPSYGECKKIIGDELKRLCQQCYNKVQALLEDPRNTPDYQRLRQRLSYIKEIIDGGYEQTRSEKKANNIRYSEWPTLMRDKKAKRNLLNA